MPTAFLLGAGLGTRLRPLTQLLPKPLVPAAHRPLLTWAFAHLAEDLGCDQFIINTHHLPDAYAQAFPKNTWNGHPLIFRHEPVLLDTGGGLANIRDLLPRDEPIVVYNGDILTRLPLGGMRAHHESTGADATLLLRSNGPLRNVTCEAATDGRGPITDIRGLLGATGPRAQFTGICLLSPRFLDMLPPPGGGAVYSLIPRLIAAIEAGLRVEGVIENGGPWLDLGTWQEVHRAHMLLGTEEFPLSEDIPRHHPESQVAPDCTDTVTWAGPGVRVETGARIRNSVLLHGCRVAPDADLDGCLVGPGEHVTGPHKNALLCQA